MNRFSFLTGEERQTFFIHIPKAAGTSFMSFLCSHFEEEQILRDAYWESVRKQPIRNLDRYRLISGHTGYELVFHLKNPFIVTVMREPIDRLCSVYEFLKELFERTPEVSHPDPDVAALFQLWKAVMERPFEAFLESPEEPVRAALLENPQARQFAQSTPYLLTDFSDDLLRQLAISRLATIDVVGCVEHFAETVDLTCRRKGWAPPEDLRNYYLNVTENRPVRDGLDATVRKKIERLCAVDLELYEIARARLFDDLRNSA
ncbi:MAG: sulfotransferase family 2 domain-containing protein [Blastocatellia bacterium]|nr:sulfotransferase family 2 domain-containing protein [Blastocatellia bacterium]